MKMLLKILMLLYFTLNLLSKSQDEWSIYKKYDDDDKEVRLVLNEMNLISTKGLENHLDITWLDSGTNNLMNLNEISLLINLKFLSLSSNQLQSLEGLEKLTLLNHVYLA